MSVSKKRIGRPPKPLQAQFEEKFVRGKDSECWLWQGPFNHNGYGVFGFKQWRAHRYSWTQANGPIPAGLLVLHSCDTPACVNPAHLRVGTQKENMADCVQRGRRAKRSNKRRLTDEQVRTLREEYRRGQKGSGLITLGKRYGISQTTVAQIVQRKTYRSVV